MFSIPHLIIVFVVALVVFGPEKLPELARNLGKIMGEFKRATGDLRSTFEGHLRDLEKEADQRRIANLPTTPPPPAPLPASSSAASAAAMEEEVSSALGAVGTVPTTPPHLGIGTPLTEPSLALGAPDETTTTKTASTEITPAASPTDTAAPQQSPTLAVEHNPESLTDAGTRPA
jgi:sec-independent protein translocase protein TatB